VKIAVFIILCDTLILLEFLKKDESRVTIRQVLTVFIRYIRSTTLKAVLTCLTI
jgi:hypothetical protein